MPHAPLEGGPGLAQDTYRELIRAAYPELRRRAEAGEENARRWLERFLTLGRQLGVRVAEPGMTGGRPDRSAAVAGLVRDLRGQRRVPSAAYRLQFNKDFTFRNARDLVPYLHTLGASDCYASPLLQACSGSSHGYDVCDHSRLNSELGGEEDFDAFAAALQAHGMGLILDAVPNHMGIHDHRNLWWMDVLENGPSSVYAPFFDIDWHPVNPDLENKVLLPFLEDQYGRVLEAGKIRLAFEGGAFFLRYYQIRLPVSPCTYPAVLEPALLGLAPTLGEGHDALRELRSILTALRYLPPRTECSPDKVSERNREKEIIKRRVTVLYEAH